MTTYALGPQQRLLLHRKRLIPVMFRGRLTWKLVNRRYGATLGQACKQINRIQIYSDQIKSIQIKSNQMGHNIIQIKSNRDVQIYLDIWLFG